MNNYSKIQQKLNSFIKKYYINEIIKGSILFLSFGLLYFFFTLFIEYFLWLKPTARTILFWVFIIGEATLLTKFILIPIFKLLGMQKGINFTQASNIIGNHFKEINDKLLNILQLQEIHLHGNNKETDLIIASIEQKAEKLQPIPFKNAIDFKLNYKYIKYLSIPVIIWLFTLISGNNTIFIKSFDRVVHHKTAYSPPVPFKFKILNKELISVENKPFLLHVTTVGNVAPDHISIHFNSEKHYLKKETNLTYTYNFESLDQDINFNLEAESITSKLYSLKVLETPNIIDFQMLLQFPKYTKRKQKLIKNTGNATILEGTSVTWKIISKNTENIQFLSFKNDKKDLNEPLKLRENNVFEFKKNIKQNINYQINTSNKDLKNYEKLNYNLKVLKDEYPSIRVKSDMDSVLRGNIQFAGQLSDDYGINRLQIVAKNLVNQNISKANISIGKSDFEEFYYVFPTGLKLNQGSNYEIYFEVFDNDGVNGSKKTRSNKFYYNHKSQEEINKDILEEQKQNIEDIENSTKSAKDLQKKLDEFEKKLKSKKNSDWNDINELNNYVKRQQEYHQMLKNNTNALLNNLEESEPEKDAHLKENKEALKERLKEIKELQKQQKLLEELKKLADKLKKEDLLKDIDKISKQSKQETRSLERILELTKRFYVEKKGLQIINKLDELSKEQLKLSQTKKNSKKVQEKLNQKFDSIQKDFDLLKEQNKKLKQPLNIQDTKKDQKLIEEEMKSALEELNKRDNPPDNISSSTMKKAKEKQQNASKKMKALSKQLRTNFEAMEKEGIEEDIKNLEQILENLLTFSFDQEALMKNFKNVDSKNAQYPEMLKKQIQLKENFEYIDDSLYTLSLRQVKLSSSIQKDLADVHYNLDQSLTNISNNKISLGITNQHYTMTSANNLGNLLSDVLQSLQNKKPGKGNGKGKKGNELSLPDIIKKQGELVKKMKEGIKPGDKSKAGNSEKLSGEQYQIYQEQNKLKGELKKLLETNKNNSSKNEPILHQMETLEKLLLEKGITKESMDRMQKVEYELLKLETATLDQGQEKERKSKTNNTKGTVRQIKSLRLKKLYFTEDEILIRQDLNLQPIYRERLKTYFKN